MRHLIETMLLYAIDTWRRKVVKHTIISGAVTSQLHALYNLGGLRFKTMRTRMRFLCALPCSG